MVFVNSIILLGALGFGFGTFLAFAAKKFEVKEDPRLEKIVEVLPSANCGACGYPGCEAFAKAVLKGEAPKDGCLPGKAQGVSEKIKKILEED